MTAIRLFGPLLGGHKGPAVLVPFDPAERWGIEETALGPGRRGFRVRASIKKIPFDSAIVSRLRRNYLTIDKSIVAEAGCVAGKDVEIFVEPMRGPVAAKVSPTRQLSEFIARFTPEIAALARKAVAKMRRRLPGAHVLVYDNYNALAVGFGPSERTSEALLSIAVFPNAVALCFVWGVRLDDPEQLLRGEGTQVRTLRLEKASDLDKPAVVALIEQAQELADHKVPAGVRGQLIIKSVSARQRPRRPE